MSKKKIFISYSRGDTEYVSSLVESLRKQDFDVWFDKNIRTGSEWDNTIEKEIQGCDAMVLVLSKTSVASDNVKDEMSYAMQLNKSVNPIRIDECDVPMRLARKQYIDFTVVGHDEGFKRLVDDIRANLKVPEQAKAAPAASFDPPKPKASTPQQAPPKKRKVMPYIIGGMAGVILLIVLMIAIPAGGDGETTDMGESQLFDGDNDQEWLDTQNKRSIGAYLEYIIRYGDNDPYYEDAQNAINALMKVEGIIVYSEPGGNPKLEKIVYATDTSDFEVGDGGDLTPRGDDILLVLEDLEVYGKESGQIIDGEYIYKDQYVRVIEVTETTDDYIFLYVAYSK